MHTHTRAGLGSRQVNPEEVRQLCLETHILENDPYVRKAMGAGQEGRHHGQLQRSVHFTHRPLRLGEPWVSRRDHGVPRTGGVLAGNAKFSNVWYLVFIKWLLYDKLFCDFSWPAVVVHTQEFLSPICCLSFDKVGRQEAGNTQEHLQHRV